MFAATAVALLFQLHPAFSQNSYMLSGIIKNSETGEPIPAATVLWSYGVELLLRKNSGRFTGWLAYTLSKTFEQFPQINSGHPFPARQDRTHDLALVALYDLNSRWQCGITWVYMAGNAVTFPRGGYVVDGRFVPYYTERNGYRMPAYHRLDFSITYKFSEKSDLNLSVYNVYNRMNAYAILFRAAGDNPRKAEAVQLTLFPLIPSLTYNFRF